MNKTVLVAEDQLEVSNYIELALRMEGYRVVTARDNAEIRERLQDLNGSLTLVLLELTMPHQDPVETVREIRRAHPRLPILVFSGASSPAVMAEVLQCGNVTFLTKPFTHEQLVAAIRKTVQAAPPSPAAAPGSPAAQSNFFWCRNPRMQAIIRAVQQSALSDVPVVIRGESGVGKEVLAREIHAQSSRRNKPFLKINCAALPSELLESELFGYERGAFTGAAKSTRGKFEAADGGVILLDEIGDMDVRLQAKLLHVLQDNEFQRLGSYETVRVNVRVLAATHCDLEKAIAEQRFRADLYHRLNVITIEVPPLRERKDEIIPLAEYFLAKHAPPGVVNPGITPTLEQSLLAYDWPGNIRELENLMRKYLVFGDASIIVQDLTHRARLRPAESDGAAPADSQTVRPILEELEEDRREREKQAIIAALNETHWNRVRAAALLKTDYRRLLYKIRKCGIAPSRDKARTEDRRANQRARAAGESA